MSDIELLAKEKKHDDNKNNFVVGSDIYILGVFDEDINQYVIPKFYSLIKSEVEKKKPKITIHINSQGGYAAVLDALVSLVELAKSHGILVETIVTGMAYSCGSMLAIIGTKGHRYISEYSEHLVHLGSGGARVTTTLQLARNSDYLKRHFERLIAHYKKYSNVPKLREHMKDDDFYIPSDMCIKWGLADKFLSEMKL